MRTWAQTLARTLPYGWRATIENNAPDAWRRISSRIPLDAEPRTMMDLARLPNVGRVTLVAVARTLWPSSERNRCHQCGAQHTPERRRVAAVEEKHAVDIARAIYAVPLDHRLDALALALHLMIAGDLLRDNAPGPENEG